MIPFRYKYVMVKSVILLILFLVFFISNSLNASEIESNSQLVQSHSNEIRTKPDPKAQDSTAVSSQDNLIMQRDSRPANSVQVESISLSQQNYDYRNVSTQGQKEDVRTDNVSVVHLGDNPVAKAAVEKSISLFSKKIRDRFSLWLSRSGKYLDLMKEILKSKNLPEDIAFLPLIESGFNPAAYSVAKAVGPWQFIASTAKRYGLKIDWWRDERRDPIKSTVAAADYLKDLYDMFGSWNLAMAAYNAGEGKILKALNRTKKDDYWELTSTKYLKKETKEYVPKFVAARMIATNPDEYGFEKIDYHSPFDYDEVIINHPLDLEVAARCADTTIEVIRELNPELRRWSTPPGESTYSLRIPSGKKEEFLENLSKIPEEEWFTIERYKVKKGDTIKKIASRMGIPISVILELNDGLRNIKPGETILLPPKGKYKPDRDDIIKRVSYKGIKKKTHPLKSRASKATKKDRTDKKRLVVASLEKDHLID